MVGTRAASNTSQCQSSQHGQHAIPPSDAVLPRPTVMVDPQEFHTLVQ